MFFSLNIKSRVFVEGKISSNCNVFKNNYFTKTAVLDSVFTHSHLQDTETPVKSCMVSHVWWFFLFETSSWKHAAGEPPFPRLLPLRLHSCIAVHASKTSKDQLVLLWELQGPTSPTDITFSSFISSPQLWLTHVDTHTACTCVHATDAHSTSKGNRCYYLRSSPTLIKMWQLAYCSSPPFFLAAIDFPGLM